MAAEKGPRAPEGLKSRSQRLWGAVNKDFELAPHELALLEEACRALDRADQARELVDEKGPVVSDRFGQLRAHPALAIERDMRGLFVRCLRELGLDPSTIDTRPLRLKGREQ
jgi:P27 family predicted phage terminase small subunit